MKFALGENSLYTGSALKRELNFCNGYLSLLYFCLQLLPNLFAVHTTNRLLFWGHPSSMMGLKLSWSCFWAIEVQFLKFSKGDKFLYLQNRGTQTPSAFCNLWFLTIRLIPNSTLGVLNKDIGGNFFEIC